MSRGEGIRLVDINVSIIKTPCIAEMIFFGPILLFRFQCSKQAILVNEGQQYDPEPGHGLSVGIALHYLGVKITDTAFFTHKRSSGHGNCVVRIFRKHRHELFHWTEGLSKLKALAVFFKADDILEVTGKRRIMKGKIPLPTGYSMVIVAHDPGQAHDILSEELFTSTTAFDILRLTFVAIIAIAPSRLVETDVIDHLGCMLVELGTSCLFHFVLEEGFGTSHLFFRNLFVCHFWHYGGFKFIIIRRGSFVVDNIFIQV
mmetsp:Transcript_29421/g.67666  ORF Transcript_29421/g.67666 Transcript_29421/m.67666 type:complete len:259 (-) Transcript_29421:2146-2922(-)